MILLSTSFVGCGTSAEGGDCSTSASGCTFELALEVTHAAARSCEAVLEEDGASVADVRFEGGVDGAFVHEAPRTAASFSVREDRRIPSVTVQAVGDGTVAVGSSRCFDAAGNSLGADLVVIGGRS